MEFQQLVSFVAVAEEHNFGRAAHRLHLAQSSVSLQVKRLEREVGVELLARAQHPFTAMSGNEEYAKDFFNVIAGALPGERFFAPDNVARMVGGARA